MADKGCNLARFRLRAQVAIRDNLTSELLLTSLQVMRCDTILIINTPPRVKDVTGSIYVLVVTATSESDTPSKNHNLVKAEGGEHGIHTWFKLLR